MPLVMLLALSSAAAAPPDRQAEVNRLLFELCPRVVSGEIDLGNREHVERLGLRIRVHARPSEHNWVEAQTGAKQKRITIGFKTFTGKRACQVRFGGKDNTALLRSVVRAGEARGWRAGAGAAELGGFVSFLYPPPPDTRLIMFTHWPEFDGLKPATNVGLIVMTEP